MNTTASVSTHRGTHPGAGPEVEVTRQTSPHSTHSFSSASAAMAPGVGPEVVSGPDSAEAAELEQCELIVGGMTCASCVRRIEKALVAVPGVKQATVNLATSKATIRHDATVTTKTLANAIVEAGYQVVEEDQKPPPPAGPSSGGSMQHAVARDRAAALHTAEERELTQLKRDLLVSSVLTVPLLVIAMSHGAIPGTEGVGGQWLQLALATPVVFGPGARFLRLAWRALRHGAADMNTLVSIGTLAAWMYSATAVVAPGLFPHAEHGIMPHLYFEAAAAIITFVLLGKLLETRARRRLSDAVKGLVALVPRTARRIRGHLEEDIGIEQLEVGDLILVKPGERIPTDGTVVKGSAAVDESMLTGESLPVDKTPGATVFGGTLAQSGALSFRVTRTGGDTALARIVEAVEQAQGSKAPIARLADVISGIFVPIVLGIAFVTLGIWFALDPTPVGFATAVERFVAVLVIACPCALGLATPAAVAVGTGRGAELGVLVKGGAALETASRIDTVLFDKTGTLTEGRPTLTDVIDWTGRGKLNLLSRVAAVERESEHPVARALVEGALAQGAQPLSSQGFVSEAGYGVQAQVEGETVRIGTGEWLAQAGISAGPLDAQAAQLAAAGKTPSFVAIGGQLAGIVAVADRPTEGAQEVVSTLKRLGMEVVMVSGDRLETAQAVAAQLGITRVFAGVKPIDKARIVTEERQKGKVVAMVGDGINDAPALASADVGIAVGSGTDIAVAAADIALLQGGIRSLPTALRLARQTLRTIRQNLFWAFIYNVVGIPIAAGLLYAWTGWLLSPVLASAAMSLSSVSVLTNSLRLRRFERVQAA